MILENQTIDLGQLIRPVTDNGETIDIQHNIEDGFTVLLEQIIANGMASVQNSGELETDLLLISESMQLQSLSKTANVKGIELTAVEEIGKETVDAELILITAGEMFAVPVKLVQTVERGNTDHDNPVINLMITAESLENQENEKIKEIVHNLVVGSDEMFFIQNQFTPLSTDNHIPDSIPFNTGNPVSDDIIPEISPENKQEIIYKINSPEYHSQNDIHENELTSDFSGNRELIENKPFTSTEPQDDLHLGSTAKVTASEIELPAGTVRDDLPEELQHIQTVKSPNSMEVMNESGETSGTRNPDTAPTEKVPSKPHFIMQNFSNDTVLIVKPHDSVKTANNVIELLQKYSSSEESVKITITVEHTLAVDTESDINAPHTMSDVKSETRIPKYLDNAALDTATYKIIPNEQGTDLEVDSIRYEVTNQRIPEEPNVQQVSPSKPVLPEADTTVEINKSSISSLHSEENLLDAEAGTRKPVISSRQEIVVPETDIQRVSNDTPEINDNQKQLIPVSNHKSFSAGETYEIANGTQHIEPVTHTGIEIDQLPVSGAAKSIPSDQIIETNNKSSDVKVVTTPERITGVTDILPDQLDDTVSVEYRQSNSESEVITNNSSQHVVYKESNVPENTEERPETAPVKNSDIIGTKSIAGEEYSSFKDVPVKATEPIEPQAAASNDNNEGLVVNNRLINVTTVSSEIIEPKPTASNNYSTETKENNTPNNVSPVNFKPVSSPQDVDNIENYEYNRIISSINSMSDEPKNDIHRGGEKMDKSFAAQVTYQRITVEEHEVDRTVPASEPVKPEQKTNIATTGYYENNSGFYGQSTKDYQFSSAGNVQQDDLQGNGFFTIEKVPNTETGAENNSQGIVNISEKTAPFISDITAVESGGSSKTNHEHETQEILNSIVRHAKFLNQKGLSSAVIKLEPPNLGHLKLDIITENSKVFGRITVETAEVQQLVQNNISQLLNNLEQNGLKVDSFDVQVGHNGGSDGWARMKNNEIFTDSKSTQHSVVDNPEESGINRLQSTRFTQNTSIYSEVIDIWI